MKKLINIRCKGFTLVELLMVVLIIGILTAMAVPVYQRAVDHSRYSALMPVSKAMANAEEVFYLGNGSYTETFNDLSVDVPADIQDSVASLDKDTRLVLNAASTHQNIRATKDSLDSRYVIYFNYSPHFPGDVHCEALTKSARAKALCQSLGGTELGTAGSYTTYLLEGNGLGTLVAVPKKVLSTGGDCGKNYGSNTASCNRTTYEDGSYMEHRISKGAGAQYYNTEYLYDADGNLIRTITKDYWGGFSVTEYDPVSGQSIESVSYGYNNRTGWENTEDFSSWSGYDENGERVRVVQYGTDYSVSKDGEWLEYLKDRFQGFYKDPYTGEDYTGGLRVYDYNDGTSINFDKDGNIVSYTTSVSTPTGEGWYDEDAGEWYYDNSRSDTYSYDRNGNLVGYSYSDDYSGDGASYTYYTDGSIRSAYTSYDWGESSGTYYYDQQGNLSKYTTNYDEDSYSFYSNGNVQNISLGDNGTEYRYNENGSLAYYSTDWGDTAVYFNDDGSINTSKSYGYDSSINVNDLPSASSWLSNINTNTSWDEKPNVPADMSTWKTREDYPDTYPTPRTFCEKYPEDSRCI